MTDNTQPIAQTGGKAPQTNLQRLLSFAHRFSWLAGIGAFMYFGEHGGDGGFVKELWEQAKVASPFAACLSLFLLFDQVRERREAQRQCQDRTIDFIIAHNTANIAVEKLISGANGLGREVAELSRLVGELLRRTPQRKGR